MEALLLRHPGMGERKLQEHLSLLADKFGCVLCSRAVTERNRNYRESGERRSDF